MSWRIATIALVAVLAAGVAGTASATPPDHFTDSIDYSGSAACGTFNDMFQGHLDVSGITTFDQAGNPVRDVVHITGWERNWRSDRPSVTFTAKRSFTSTFDYATSTEQDTGMIFSATAPGQGLLFHDVGNIRFDDATGTVISIHGPHDSFVQGDAAFCNALLAIS